MESDSILIFGKTGQLGKKLTNTLQLVSRGIIDSPRVNFLFPNQLYEIINYYKPGVIINAAAFTDVDGAEMRSKEAFKVNADAVELIAKSAKKIGATLIHFSTDYVFDGKKAKPYTEDDQPNPINQYGQSKLLGEQAIQHIDGNYLIFRLSWLYSIDSPSFVSKVLSWARNQKTIKLVDDQIGSPTSANFVAKALTETLLKNLTNKECSLEKYKGLYHLAGKGKVSRFEWGKTIINSDPEKHQQVVDNLVSAKTSDFPIIANRPSFSALDCQKFISTFGYEISNWKEMLLSEMTSK